MRIRSAVSTACCALLLALTGANAPAQGWVPYPPVVVVPAPMVPVAPGYDPCRDGSINWGRPVNCEELMRSYPAPMLYYQADPAYDPCRDGRIKWGRPVDCEALMRGRRDPRPR